ncbi:hypothetical protein Pan153_48450 [Gimesia panareensis]|uniref:Uncharacterized protein n=1 Tax=Gimesia panareensis TaxID=2527978 RepID=A0A518FV17_9PLAN|nr:acyl carrier protein [Gimesia panareensis]QDV20173.1 hypothetical protein Pan153_48450 [Gimesia panareensis]
MNQTRYSDQQIMSKLAELMVDMYGLDDDEAPDPVRDLDLRVDLYLKKHKVWDMVDLLDFMFRFERAFQIRCSAEEWKKLFGRDRGRTEEEWVEQVGQHLTFKKLVDFIAEHTTYISFQPVTVIDRECGPAGAFYGITELSEQLVPPACQITPATRIIDAFRGDALDQFWSELCWRSTQKLPDISRKWDVLFFSGCLLSVLGLLFGIPLSIVTTNYLYALVPCVYLLANWKVYTLYNHYSDPLPTDLQTFRDLAILIAGQNHEAERGINVNTHRAAEGLS